MVRRAQASGVTSDHFFESDQAPSLSANKPFAKIGSYDGPPKDEKEIELEKLIFGDDAAFHDDIKEHNERAESSQLFDEASVDKSQPAYDSSDDADLEELEDAQLFFLDSGTTAAARPKDLQISQERKLEEADTPAWLDSDDDRIAISLATHARLRKLRRSEDEDIIIGSEYKKRLIQQFESLHPLPAWAISKSSTHRKKRRRTSLSGSSSDEFDIVQDDEAEQISAPPLKQLLSSTDPLTKSLPTSNGKKKIRQDIIDIQRIRDVSGTHLSSITSLDFHTLYPILLSSGPSGLLTINHISPSASSPNPVLTKVAIPRHPIETSVVHPAGGHVYIGSRRRYFHIWDLNSGRVNRVTRIYGHAEEQRTCERFKLSPCGRYMALVGSGRKGGGMVNVLDATTGQWICQTRVEGNGGVADFEWWRDGEGLVVLGKGGEAVEYSLRERKVLARWQDEGGVGITVVAMGGSVGESSDNGLGGDKWIAVGSQSGIVNIYDRGSWSTGKVPQRPIPKRAMQQLVTPTSHLKFSFDGQLLVMASQWKKDALRLVHLPSCTVYRNWPTSGTPFGRITAVAWGQRGSLLAVANEQGKIRLWEVRT